MSYHEPAYVVQSCGHLQQPGCSPSLCSSSRGAESQSQGVTVTSQQGAVINHNPAQRLQVWHNSAVLLVTFIFMFTNYVQTYLYSAGIKPRH